MTDADLIRSALDASGLTVTAFAAHMGRSRASVYRWLGGALMADTVRQWLLRFLAERQAPPRAEGVPADR